MRKLFLVVLLVLACCLKFLGVFNVSTLTVEQNDNKVMAIRVSDFIVSPMANEMQELLINVPNHKGVVLIFNSQGGSVTEGEKIIEILESHKKRGLTINTVVENGAVCASMCIPIYMQGQKRYAGARSTFMIHGVYLGLQRHTPDIDQTKSYLSRLVKFGVNSSWLDILWKQNIFTDSKEYWLNAEELVEQESNIVTDLTPRVVSFGAI